FEWKSDLSCSREGHLLRIVLIASRRPISNEKLVRLSEEASDHNDPLLHQPPVSNRKIWIDVGAHYGEKTLKAAESDQMVTVYAFEPNPLVASKLIGRRSNYVPVAAAIGEHDGMADFYINSFSGADSLLPLDEEGVRQWAGGDQLTSESRIHVP